MNLKKYNDFIESKPVKENLDQAKKFLKQSSILYKAASDLGIIDYDKEEKIYNGGYLSLKDFSNEEQEKLKKKMRDIKLSEHEIKNIEKNEDFLKIKEMLKDNMGWMYNFTYMHFIELKPLHELENIFNRIVELKNLLNKLPEYIGKKFDHDFIDPLIPNSEEIRDNAEILTDGLDKLEEYQKIKKTIDVLPKQMRRQYKKADENLKKEFNEMVFGFYSISDEKTNVVDEYNNKKLTKRKLIWQNFFGSMKLDRQRLLPDGSKNPNYNQWVWTSRIKRYLSSENPLEDLIKAGKKYLKSLVDSGYNEKIKQIDNVNDKYGKMGADIVFDESQIIIIDVKSFIANKDLNSDTSHCIVDYQSTWDNYISPFDVQYYIYNYNLDLGDSDRIIGVTINKEGNVKAAHDKNDGNLKSTIGDLLKKFAKDNDIDDNLMKYLKPMSKEQIKRIEKMKEYEREVIKDADKETIKKYIEEYNGDINIRNGIILYNAAVSGDIDKIKMILDYGANANGVIKNNPIISYAEDIEVIKLLIEYGAKMTSKIFSTIANNPEALKFCIDAGLDVNFDKSFPIRASIRGSWKNNKEPGEGYTKSLEILLDNGASIGNDGDANMDTIMRWIFEYGRTGILKVLKEKNILKTIPIDVWEKSKKWLEYSRKIPEERKEQAKEYIDSLTSELKQ